MNQKNGRDVKRVIHGQRLIVSLVVACVMGCTNTPLAKAAPRAPLEKATQRALEVLPAWTDQASGAKIVQLTSRAATSTNVHNEVRYTSADGNRIAIQRSPFGRPQEVWVCDLSRRMMIRVGEGKFVAASYARNAAYYTVPADGGARLMRLDMVKLTSRQVMRFDKEQVPRRVAISPDERWLIGGAFKVRGKIRRLRRTDLRTGKTTTLCDIKDMWNPHLQFNPANPRQLLAQVNRSGKTKDGPLGATLVMIDVKTGKVTPLPVGVPHTPSLSGHESWVGHTGRVLFTVAPGTAESLLPSRGVYAVTPGDKAPRPVALGKPFNHIGVSDDGQFFIVDDYRTQEIFVGNIETGRFLKLCDSRTRQGRPQYSHAHPYMTPGNKHVIFNSNESGVAQVYAARIPEGFLEKLSAKKK